MQTALPYLLAALAFIFIRIINYNILTPGILSPIVKFKILSDTLHGNHWHMRQSKKTD